MAHEKRKGAIIALMAICLPILLLLSAFAVNLAWLQLSRTQAIIVADAATRAAGRTYSLTGSVDDAMTRAKEAASKNVIAGKSVTIAAADFTLGASTRPGVNQRYTFKESKVNPNALKVTIKKLKTHDNGEISFLLPGVLAMPYYEVTRSAISTRVDVDIAFVVDRSGSMAYAANEKAVYPPVPKAAPAGWDFGQAAPNPSRWRDLAAGANSFIDEMDKSSTVEFCSLVTYGDTASTDRGMTSDYSLIRSGIDGYTTNFNSGKTNISDGLSKGVDSLTSGSARNFASKVVILMTDGMWNLGSDPVAVATTAAKDGIIIFTITFSDEADQSEMKKVAEAGNGQHFHAKDAASLSSVLQTIIRILPTVLTE